MKAITVFFVGHKKTSIETSLNNFTFKSDTIISDFVCYLSSRMTLFTWDGPTANKIHWKNQQICRNCLQCLDQALEVSTYSSLRIHSIRRRRMPSSGWFNPIVSNYRPNTPCIGVPCWNCLKCPENTTWLDIDRTLPRQTGDMFTIWCFMNVMTRYVQLPSHETVVWAIYDIKWALLKQAWCP